MPPHAPADRRPLRSRDIKVFQRLAAGLASLGVSPNAISVASVVFAAGAGVCFWATAQTTGPATRASWLAAAVLVQLRLLANMLDGMVAIESGKASPVGELYNEVPDRLADPFVLVGVGYAVGGDAALGYTAGLLALFVAYVRALGASAGAGQQFIGPMAKPQRMAAVTLLGLYGAAAPVGWQPVHEGTGWGVAAGVLWLVIVGSIITAGRRLRVIARHMKEGA